MGLFGANALVGLQSCNKDRCVHIDKVITNKRQQVFAVLSLWFVQYVNYCFAVVNYVSFSIIHEQL